MFSLSLHSKEDGKIVSSNCSEPSFFSIFPWCRLLYLITIEQVWQLIADAAHSPLSREQTIELLVLALRRQLQYLAYREQRGRQTAYDEVAQQDVEALARAIHLLQEKEAEQ